MKDWPPVSGALRLCGWRRATAVLLLAGAAGTAWGAVPPRWKDSGYAYNAQGAPLLKVLSDFARSHGVDLRADAGLVEPVPGTVKMPNAADFLDQLGARHRFQWFVYNQVLYVSPLSDSVTERIDVGRDAVADAKAVLTGVGLFEPKFGWGEMQESGSVTVSGPREYVRLARQVLAERDRSDDYEAMVFRLRNAAVEDRSVTIRNQTVVTPGAASLLKSMLSQRGSGSRGFTSPGGIIDGIVGQSSTPQGSNVGTSGTGSVSATNVARRDSTPVAGSGGGRGVSIEGDVRTNSIVIYDLTKRRGYYQRLIDAIDVPQHLVEIEACVVDVNRDQMTELGFGVDATKGKAHLVVDPAAVLAAPLTGGSTLIVSSLDRFFARLSLMERDGNAHVVAKPSVLTLENLVAVLDLSQTVYVRATGERVASIEAVTAGMLLRVTPRVVKDKQSTQVHLTVDIEDGKVLPAQAGTDGTPEVQRSTISTQAILLDRQSLIIGGYDTTTTSNSDNAVPGVSKIPLIGALFSGTKKVNQSRQRLFILTPRLVKPDVVKRTS